MSLILRALRSIALGLHLLGGIVIAALIFGWAGAGIRHALTLLWSRNLLRILGVRTSINGSIGRREERGLIIIANHVSWLDIFLLSAIHPIRFISKSEVRSWPLLGWLATLTGTLYIERARQRDTARVNKLITGALSRGECLAFFPEGSTTDGREIKPFLASLFQPAIDAEAQLQPIALRYFKADGSPDLAPAYYGDISLAETLKQIMGQRCTQAEVSFLSRMESKGHNRKTLARQAEHIISSALNLADPRTKPEKPGDPQGARP
ncbi:MAG: lysophospholipid acyltransferase family protein [Sulfuricellaceae bacterium]|nr:lysophospholipid acyltransferase family protein [Sulfuricellaceae bacterium]